jgi:TPR repeat protein
MKTNTLIIILAVIVSVQSTAIAQALEIPTDKPTDNTQLDNMLSRAYIGDGAEQYNLGYHYLYGKGVKQSDSEAKKWFDLAAKSKSPAVRYKIGRLYQTGVHYLQDINKAVFHYEFAAKNGEIYALNNLAILYLNGEGVIRDIDKGISFAKQAALRGNAEAQVNLGLVYLNGTGVPKDNKEALKWFSEASKDHNPVALYYLAEHAYAEKDYVKAYDYYLMSAEQSNDNAQLKLALLYAKGLGIEKNITTATDWLTKAAELGNKQAMGMLKKRGK